ncbi:MAG: hypothetical protein R2880_10040 [Deinococcales bacterium]
MLVSYPIGYGGKGLKTKVNTNSTFRFDRGMMWVMVTHVAYQSAVLSSFYSYTFNLAKLMGISTFNPANLGEFDIPSLKPTVLSISQYRANFMLASPLELWKVRSFFKEILKRPIQIFEGLLQTIGICSIEPVINCFQAGKLTTLPWL